MPGPNSTGRRNRHLHPSFVPKFNFIRCFERRDQFPFPVHSPSRPEGVCPLPCLFNIPLVLASTPLAVANHPALDSGNRESYFV